MDNQNDSREGESNHDAFQQILQRYTMVFFKNSAVPSLLPISDLYSIEMRDYLTADLEIEE